jgi:Nif-specific regulatory protein
VIDVDEIACVGDACPSPLLRPSAREAPAPLGLDEPAAAPPTTAPAAEASALSAPSARARQELIDAMEKSGWVQAKAARLLGMTPRQIAYALKKHGIDVVKF